MVFQTILAKTNETLSKIYHFTACNPSPPNNVEILSEKTFCCILCNSLAFVHNFKSIFHQHCPGGWGFKIFVAFCVRCFIHFLPGLSEIQLFCKSPKYDDFKVRLCILLHRINTKLFTVFVDEMSIFFFC